MIRRNMFLLICFKTDTEQSCVRYSETNPAPCYCILAYSSFVFLVNMAQNNLIDIYNNRIEKFIISSSTLLHSK